MVLVMVRVTNISESGTVTELTVSSPASSGSAAESWNFTVALGKAVAAAVRPGARAQGQRWQSRGEWSRISVPGWQGGPAARNRKCLGMTLRRRCRGRRVGRTPDPVGRRPRRHCAGARRALPLGR